MACGGSGQRLDPRAAAGPPRAPTFLDNVIAAVFWAGVAAVVTLVMVGRLTGWLITVPAVQSAAALLPAGPTSPDDESGTMVGVIVVALLVLAAAVALTVVRRLGARRWLADVEAPYSQLRRLVAGWSLLRTLVLMFGAAVVGASAVLLTSTSREWAQWLAYGADDVRYTWIGLPSVFQWGLVTVSIAMWTVFTMSRTLGKYHRLADLHDPVSDGGSGHDGPGGAPWPPAPPGAFTPPPPPPPGTPPLPPPPAP